MTETAAAIAFNPGRGEPLQGSVGFRAPFARTRIVSLVNSGDVQKNARRSQAGWFSCRGRRSFPAISTPGTIRVC